MSLYYTDRTVSPGVDMALSAIYNKKLADKAEVVRYVVEKAMPVLHKIMTIPSFVRVRVAPIKARNINGRYINGENLCEIDCRLGWDQALETLCHEMVHAEQYFTGRLSSSFVRRKGYIHTWNGSLDYNKGSTYRAYRQQPWEMEAFGRQKGLADRVNEILGVK